MMSICTQIVENNLDASEKNVIEVLNQVKEAISAKEMKNEKEKNDSDECHREVSLRSLFFC